mgnify:FL=1
MTAAVVNAMYYFRLPENIFAKTIVPQLRWDMGENIKFVNLRRAMDSFDTHRVTVGLCFGLTERVVQSEVRLNYEHYFLDGKPVDYSDNPLLQNKFTVEFFARF